MIEEVSNAEENRPPNMRAGHSLFLRSHGYLHALGFLSTLIYGYLCVQSRGVEPVPIFHFFACMGAVWGALVGAFFLYGKGLPKGALIGILIWAALFRIVGIAANPILAEDDYFRFMWDGYRFAVTGDPYQGVPADFLEDETLPASVASIVYDINYPELPTIYGPIMELVFLASYKLAPASLIALKCLFVLFEGLLLFLLSRLLSLRWFLVASWCPLLVFETSFQAHPDVVGVSLMVVAYWAARRQYPWISMLVLGLATCAKPFAVLLWPFIVQERRWFAQGVLLALVLGFVYLPFLLQNSDAGATSLGAMATEWEFNSIGYALLQYLFGDYARLASLTCFAGVYLWLLIRFWHQKKREEVKEPPLDFVYAALFFFSPVINPWYLMWLFPFVLLKPRSWSLVALGVVSLSYATGLNLGDRSLEEFEIPLLVQGLEFGLITAAVIYGVYEGSRKRKSEINHRR